MRAEIDTFVKLFWKANLLDFKAIVLNFSKIYLLIWWLMNLQEQKVLFALPEEEYIEEIEV